MDGSQKTNEEVPSDLVSILKEPPQTEQPAIDKESSLGALEIAARKAEQREKIVRAIKAGEFFKHADRDPSEIL